MKFVSWLQKIFKRGVSVSPVCLYWNRNGGNLYTYYHLELSSMKQAKYIRFRDRFVAYNVLKIKDFNHKSWQKVCRTWLIASVFVQFFLIILFVHICLIFFVNIESKKFNKWKYLHAVTYLGNDSLYAPLQLIAVYLILNAY